MADINDRLERLNRREELARRANLPPVSAPADGLGEDFAEVLDAVARAVLRHPGLSIMVAPADGRPGRAVVRVTEHDGTVQAALVMPPSAPAPPTPVRPEPVDSEPRVEHTVPLGYGGPRPAGAESLASWHVDDPAVAPYPGGRRTADDDPEFARYHGGRRAAEHDVAVARYPGGRRAADDDDDVAGYPGGRRAADDDAAVAGYPGGRRAADDDAAVARYPGGRRAADDDAAVAGHPGGRRAADDDAAVAGYPGGRRSADDDAAAARVETESTDDRSGGYGVLRATEPRETGRHAEGGARVSPFPGTGPSWRADGAPYYRSTSDHQPYTRRGSRPPLRAVETPADEPAQPELPEDSEREATTGPNGLVTLPSDTSEVVARLARLLRDDPSLAAGWARDRRQ